MKNTTTPTRTPAISVGVDANRMELALLFSDGTTATLQANQLSDEIKAIALMHGLKQKLVDAAAISRDPVTGRAASIDTKKSAVMEVLTRLERGEWNKRREGGTGGTGGLLYRALCQLYPSKTPEDIKEFLEGKDAKEQAALRANPRVAAIIDQLRAAESEVDTDSMLEQLGE